MIQDTLLQRIKNGEVIKGTHIFAGAPILTECIAQAGYDVIWIDMEHTQITTNVLMQNLIAAKAGGTPAVVRIPWNDPILAKPVLDMGVDGVIFPCIRTAEEAQLAVSACEYPPKGIRGFGPFRALDYGKGNIKEYIKNTSRNTIRLIQIEHIDAVENLQEIASIEGIDAFIVGMNDLSASLGYLGDTQNSSMLPVYDQIAEILRKMNKPFGVSSASDETVIRAWKARGATIFFAGHDIEYVTNGAAAMLNFMKTL